MSEEQFAVQFYLSKDKKVVLEQTRHYDPFLHEIQFVKHE